MMRLATIFTVLFYALNLSAQSPVLKLSDKVSYCIDLEQFEVDEAVSINSNYQIERQLKDKLGTEMRVRVGWMDYYIKETQYSRLELTKKKARAELEKYMAEVSESESELVAIRHSKIRKYKGMHFLTTVIEIKSDPSQNIVFAIAARVYNDYQVLSISIEHVSNSTRQIGERLLKEHIRRLNKCG